MERRERKQTRKKEEKVGTKKWGSKSRGVKAGE